jgi:predicted anti-sigma-YlaC factor YlaD
MTHASVRYFLCPNGELRAEPSPSLCDKFETLRTIAAGMERDSAGHQETLMRLLAHVRHCEACRAWFEENERISQLPIDRKELAVQLQTANPGVSKDTLITTRSWR